MNSTAIQIEGEFAKNFVFIILDVVSCSLKSYILQIFSVGNSI